MTAPRPAAAGPSLRITAVLAGAFLVAAVAGCAGGDETTDTAAVSTAPEGTVEVPDVRAPAADLSAELTHLLQEHVFLTGSALTLAVTVSPDSPRTAASAESLDRNTIALAALVEDLYDSATAKRFKLLWRAHIDRYVDYTVARSAGLEADAQEAVDALDTFQKGLAALAAEITRGVVTPDELAEPLGGQVGAVLALADALVAGSPESVAVLNQAAWASHGTASALATAIAGHLGLEGDVGDAAALLRVELTALQQAHLYLTAAAWRVALVAGPDSEPALAAAEVVRANVDSLAEALRPIWGEAGADLAALWHDQSEILLAVAVATGDPAASEVSTAVAGTTEAEAGLAALRARIIRLVTAQTGRALAVGQLEGPLKDQDADRLAAARLAGQPGGAPELYRAAQLAPEIAVLLVAGIVGNDPGALD